MKYIKSKFTATDLHRDLDPDVNPNPDTFGIHLVDKFSNKFDGYRS